VCQWAVLHPQPCWDGVVLGGGLAGALNTATLLREVHKHYTPLRPREQ